MFKLTVGLALLAVACPGLAHPYALRNVGPNLYYVYTLDNPRSPVSVLPTPASITASPISADRRTVILVHGHSGSAFTSLNPVVRDAILMADDRNVIVVDWSIYAGLSYSVAVDTIPVVAEELAAFINLLVTSEPPVVALNDLHLVGFDLGAHVVGLAARAVNGTVGRITGLSPSGSLFDSSLSRLRITDARYVEVIHTDTKGRLANGIGTAIGHIDFFANGGTNQPGCFSNACNHERAYELFAASMINNDLVGLPCASDRVLNQNLCRGLPLKMGGLESNKIGAGIYRINTKRNFPF